MNGTSGADRARFFFNAELAQIFVLLEDERENVAQMAQSVLDIQAGIISLCRTLLVNQGNAVTANNAYKLDAQP